MSLKNKVKEEVDLESILISKINELKRYALVWEWMEEHQHGEYIKYDDIVKLIATEFSGVSINIKVRKMNKKENRKDWCYIHNEEKDCNNEDGDHDDYHCIKCEINELKEPNCVICGEPFELSRSHFWDIFYICKKCENKLEDSTKCPNCKKNLSQLCESNSKNTSIFMEHMKKCNKVFIRSLKYNRDVKKEELKRNI